MNLLQKNRIFIFQNIIIFKKKYLLTLLPLQNNLITLLNKQGLKDYAHARK